MKGTGFMERFFRKWKKISKKQKRAAGTGMSIFLVLLLVLSFWGGIGRQELEVPENPIKENQACSMVALASTREVVADNAEGLKGRISNEQTLDEPQEETEPETESSEKMTESEPAGDNSTRQNSSQAGTAGSAQVTEQTPGSGSAGTDSAGNGNGTNNKKKSKNDKKDKTVSKDGKKDTEYFRTTIENGAVLSSAEFSYEIEHLTDKKVKHVKNTVNDGKASSYNGTVKLAHGKNTLLVAVTYLDDDNTPFTVSKEYTLYYEPDELVIQTDLSSQTVRKESISFQAYGQLGEEDFALTVTVNGSEISGSANYHYENVVLAEGENEIILYAKKDGQEKQETFLVIYERPQETQIRFDTDLQDQEVHKKKYTFYAQAFCGSEKLDTLCVEMDGVLQEPDVSLGEGQYVVLLEEGDNHFVLTAEKDGEIAREEYTVTYIRQVEGEGDGEGNSEAPKVTCTLGESGSNLTTAGSVMSFQVFPKDYNGNLLGASSVSITCFGDQGDNHVSLVWENLGDISYKVYLTPGNNTMLIYVTDNEDNVTQLVYTIFCEATAAGEAIGTAHISVEATTVGSGILVSEDVPIYEGEPASRAVVRLLEQCGYTVNYSGALDSGFYLAHIESQANFVTGAIPEDLRAMLEEKLSPDKLYLDDYYTNSLGEFDFTSQSGWMYQVNGVYPNYSMADCYLQNGDTMRIRFTLAYGADIGGGGANGNGTNEGESSSWGYEW